MAAARAASVWAALASLAHADECKWPQVCPGTLPRRMRQTYMMNSSTIIMPCNYSGFTDPASTAGWGVVDFDWSNVAGYGKADGWAKHKPMDDDELLLRQVQMTTAASPGTEVWVYRNSVYGYPWYSSVRRILEDPAYRDWFVHFKPEGPWYSHKCDHNHDPPLCSDLYHNTMQTPLPDLHPPPAHASCAGPACDCGKVPCGFYVFNHSTTTVVGNQTFLDWFIHSYVLNEVGSSPMVGGFFWDDVWDVECNLKDTYPQTCEDMGLTKADKEQMTRDYQKNMAALVDVVIDAGKFAWQMMWTGGDPKGIGATKSNPLVQQKTCAADLRALCKPESPAQTRAMMYQFTGQDPGHLAEFEQDLANFLLVRGPYAWLGHGWRGCSRAYSFPPELHADYGEPVGLCSETVPGSGVFVREWTKAKVEMDCNHWRPTVQLKQQPPPIAFV